MSDLRYSFAKAWLRAGRLHLQTAKIIEEALQVRELARQTRESSRAARLARGRDLGRPLPQRVGVEAQG